MNWDLQIGRWPAAQIAGMTFGRALSCLGKVEPIGDATGGECGREEGRVKVRLSDIAVLPNVFQYRTDEGTEDEREQQVKRLKVALAAKPPGQRELEPITAMEIGGTWVCIDGHHRLRAYAASGVEEITVQPLRGTIADALLEAGMANSKTKLAMTQRDRSEAAWRLTVADRHSKRDVCEATGASDGSVAEMRRVRKTLVAMGEEPGEHRWIHARMLARGDEPGERGEDWEEKQIVRFEKTLRKTFGKSVHRNRDFLSAALENLYPSLVNTLVERNALENREKIEAMFREEDESEF